MWLKFYLIISGFIFLMVSILHFFRLLYQWPITVGTCVIPQWLSYFGFPVALGYFVWSAWLLFSKLGQPRHEVG